MEDMAKETTRRDKKPFNWGRFLIGVLVGLIVCEVAIKIIEAL